MDMLMTAIISGIMVGVIYGLIATGFVVIYKCSSVLNFAHGAIVLLGAYILWSFLHIGLPLWTSIVASLAIAVILGLAVERFAIRTLLGQPLLTLVMATLALNELIRGLVIAGWGGVDLPYVEVLPRGSVHLGSVVLSQQQIACVALAAVLLVLFTLFFRYTRWGLAMRGIADGHQIARTMGVNVAAVVGVAWASACVCATLGGILLGSISGFHMKLWEVAIIAMTAAFIGGLDSIHGAIVGGIVIGVIEKLVSTYVGFAAGIPTVYFLLVVIMFFLPHGFWGRIKIERV